MGCFQACGDSNLILRFNFKCFHVLRGENTEISSERVKDMVWNEMNLEKFVSSDSRQQNVGVHKSESENFHEIRALRFSRRRASMCMCTYKNWFSLRNWTVYKWEKCVFIRIKWTSIELNVLRFLLFRNWALSFTWKNSERLAFNWIRLLCYKNVLNLLFSWIDNLKRKMFSKKHTQNGSKSNWLKHKLRNIHIWHTHTHIV